MSGDEAVGPLVGLHTPGTGEPRAGADPTAVEALRDVVRRPGAFFAALPRAGTPGRAAAFALACIAASTVLAWAATGTDDGPVPGLLLPFLFDLVFFAAYLALTHAAVLILLLRRSAGLSATFRIVAYGQVSQLVNWVPLVGLALGLVYGSVLAVIGVRRMHDAGRGLAVAVVALPVVLAAGLLGAYVVIER